MENKPLIYQHGSGGILRVGDKNSSDYNYFRSSFDLCPVIA